MRIVCIGKRPKIEDEHAQVVQTQQVSRSKGGKLFKKASYGGTGWNWNGQILWQPQYVIRKEVNEKKNFYWFF